MKLYSVIATVAICISTTACTSETITGCSIGDVDPNRSTDPGSKPADPLPPEIPGSAEMATVIGPIALRSDKWGPDPELPFSWPGRLAQKEPTDPSSPTDQAIYEIKLQPGSTLYKVHVWVDPPSGHVNVPENRAQTMIWLYNGGFSESELLGSETTMGDSVANYEQRFLLTREFPTPVEIAADSRVFIYVFGESGTYALPGLIVDTPEILFDEP